jgi:hypothetical protein
MKANTRNSRTLTSRPSQCRKALQGAKGVLLALFVALAVGCDATGPVGEEEDKSFDIDRIQVSFQPTLVHDHPSFEITIENFLDWGLEEVVVDMSYWVNDTQIGNTPMPFTAQIPSKLKARQRFLVHTLNPSRITSHEDYQCYRYEVRAEDEKGNYETKNYEGTCS